jgi:hypothetical protein
MLVDFKEKLALIRLGALDATSEQASFAFCSTKKKNQDGSLIEAK